MKLSDLRGSSPPEYHRLDKVEITVPDEEQRSRWKNPDTLFAVLRLEYTPVSYVIHGGFFGNKRVDSIRISWELTPAEAAAVATKGILGIPKEKLQLPARPNYEKPRFFFEFFIGAQENAGWDMEFDDNGQPTTAALGRVIQTTREKVSIPGSRGATFDMWMNVPQQFADDYVPPDVLPVVMAGDAPATSLPNMTTADIRDAVNEVLAGKNIDDINNNGLNIILSSGKSELMTGDVMTAARTGRLVDYLCEQGVAKVEGAQLVSA